MDFATEKYAIFRKKPKNKNSKIIVIDNGTYEIKAGFLNDLCLITRNFAFKKRNTVEFEAFSGATKVDMFEKDVIIDLEAAESIFNKVFDDLELKIKNLNDYELILTTTPNSPTNRQLTEFLYEKYNFKQIQLSYDFVLSYFKYFDLNDATIISISYSNTFVCVIENNKIVFLQKLDFGIKNLLEYIDKSLKLRFKDYRRDYSCLLKYMRFSNDYKKEAIEILNKMASGDYSKTLFLEDEKEEVQEEIQETSNKKLKTAKIDLPEIDYKLLETKDGDLSKEDLTLKRKNNLIFHSTWARIKMKINQLLEQISNNVDNLKDDIAKADDFDLYVEKKKQKFETLKRRLKERENLRRRVKNKKSSELLIKYKEKNLTDAELKLQNEIFEAEDMDMEKELVSELNKKAQELQNLVPDFIPFYARTNDILFGENINRACVSVDLIKWPEIFFNPDILHIGEMGLSEIFDIISKQFTIKNVLITGGLANVEGFKERVYSELICRSKTGDITVKSVEDPQKDAFYGAKISNLFKNCTK